MSTLKIYRICLTPLDTFFFGGEQTFGQDDESNYYAVSNKYPQQTALLGMLRQELLFQNGKDFSLIGDKSFSIDGSSTDFGIIKKLSPIFICRTGKDTAEYITWGPREFSASAVPPVAMEMGPVANQNTRFTNSVQKDLLPFLKNYKEKSGVEEYLVSLATGNKISEDQIYNDVKQVGILKSLLRVTASLFLRSWALQMRKLQKNSI